jgi:predicted Fe-Mo cluster-binding NifX family protein
MKIAIVTEDGRTVSQHFGRAPYYAILTVEGDVIVERELRPKIGPHQTGSGGAEHAGAGPHGTGPQAQSRHDQMAQAIADCAVLIAGGMGQGAYDRFAALGLRPVVTEIAGVEAAALAYARGELVNRVERLD